MKTYQDYLNVKRGAKHRLYAVWVTLVIWVVSSVVVLIITPTDALFVAGAGLIFTMAAFFNFSFYTVKYDDEINWCGDLLAHQPNKFKVRLKASLDKLYTAPDNGVDDIVDMMYDNITPAHVAYKRWYATYERLATKYNIPILS